MVVTDGMTQLEVAQQLGVSRQRVSAIEKDALEKLKVLILAHSNGSEIMEFFGIEVDEPEETVVESEAMITVFEIEGKGKKEIEKHITKDSFDSELHKTGALQLSMFDQLYATQMCA